LSNLKKSKNLKCSPCRRPECILSTDIGQSTIYASASYMSSLGAPD